MNIVITCRLCVQLHLKCPKYIILCTQVYLQMRVQWRAHLWLCVHVVCAQIRVNKNLNKTLYNTSCNYRIQCFTLSQTNMFHTNHYFLIEFIQGKLHIPYVNATQASNIASLSTTFKIWLPNGDPLKWCSLHNTTLKYSTEETTNWQIPRSVPVLEQNLLSLLYNGVRV